MRNFKIGVVGGGHMVGGGTQGFLWQHEDGSLRLLPFEIASTDRARPSIG